MEVWFGDDTPGDCGLIVSVNRAEHGADNFDGYEISLNPSKKKLEFGRHRQNWEPIQEVACEVPVKQWIPLTVRLDGAKLEMLVAGQSLLKYEDQQHPLPAGTFGVRNFGRAASFRNLKVKRAGVLSELPFASSLAVGEVSGMWQSVRRDTVEGSATLQTTRPYKGAQSQRIEFISGEGEIGVANRGLNRRGMNFVAGNPYEGYVLARCDQPTQLNFALESGDGARYARVQKQLNPGDWQKIEFALTPDHSDTAGQFTISLQQSGAVDLGFALLQPYDWGRFRDLPDRKDVAEALQREGITVMRYGGSMVNAKEYRWKNMIGPRKLRPAYHGTWYPYASNGWGILDFLSLCEALGVLGIPDFNIDETPQDMADFVEYVNGPPESKWGRRRLADGHPAPYKLKHIQLGNEENINEQYFQKFKPLMQAIWQADPHIVPVVGDHTYQKPITDPYKFSGDSGITSLAAHKQILDFGRSMKKPIWWDVHVWNEVPHNEDAQLPVIAELYDWFNKLSPGADFKICVFEENANSHRWKRGLSHARTVNALQRMGERMPIVCAANCLQPDKQNDNGWDQGFLFLSPSAVWPQPCYYVTQMIARNNKLSKCLAVECDQPQEMDITARAGDNGKTLALQVVNTNKFPQPAHPDGWVCARR